MSMSNEVRVKATIEYTRDYSSDDHNDQRGVIRITTPTGKIEATWSATGGRGDGSDLICNTTKEFDDDGAEEILDSGDLCQGIGTYDADIVEGPYGWLTIENVVWREESPKVS